MPDPGDTRTATRMVVDYVAAGPGDPLLLTRRASRVLRRADVVVTDGPGGDAAVGLAPAGAEIHHAGPGPGGPAWPPQRVVDLVVARLAAGRRVVRLVTGDLATGCGVGEEIANLAARGVEPAIAPGVSVATAAPLTAGVVPPPGTRVSVVAGDDGRAAAPLDGAALVEPGAIVVVPAGRAPGPIGAALLAAGASATTPVALVDGAGRPGSRVETTDLAGMTASHPAPSVTAVIGPLRRDDAGA